MRYEPHDYQQLATAFIEDHPQAAILLGMGLGKTVITLTAIWNLLLDSFHARRVLIVAPLRIARDPWPAEATEGAPKVKDEIITGWYQSVYEPAATSLGK